MSSVGDGLPPSLAQQALAYADALFNLARYLTGNDGDGEDLVQETYARALAAAPRFEGGNLKAWLFKILRNAFIDLYRKRKHDPTRAAPEPVGPDVEGPIDVDRLWDDLEIQQIRAIVASELE